MTGYLGKPCTSWYQSELVFGIVLTTLGCTTALEL